MISFLKRKIQFDVIADIGCGDGQFLSALLKNIPDKKVVGIDISELSTETTYKNLHDLKRRYSDMDPSAVMSGAVLLRTGSDMLAALEKILGRYGLSLGRFLTLTVLNRDPEEEITPSDLAERVGVTRATMTGLLDTLAKDGWIERIQHNEDRRRVVVRLTSEGLEHLGRILPGYFRETSGITDRTR